MAEKYLATYLNDHLAGSEVGLELLEHLERVTPAPPWRASPPSCGPTSRRTAASSRP